MLAIYVWQEEMVRPLEVDTDVQAMKVSKVQFLTLYPLVELRKTFYGTKLSM